MTTANVFRTSRYTRSNIVMVVDCILCKMEMKSTGFGYVMPCSLGARYQHFGESLPFLSLGLTTAITSNSAKSVCLK
jgi:hypothetical protein